MSSLETVVGALRRSDARSRAVPYVLHAALGAAIWVAAVLVVARITPIGTRLQLVWLGIPVIFAAAAVAWTIRRPRPDMLMQLADLRLGLHERLSTAWERRAASGVMDGLLRQDALQHAERDQLKRAFPIRVSRREASVLAVVAAAALALAVLPNPMDQVLAQRQADHASQAKAASAIRDVQQKIAAAASPAPVDPKVQKILSDAQQKIAQAQDPRQALEAISPAEQQLQQLSDPQTPARTSTAQNLASSLSATTAGQAGQALTSSPSQGAQALRDLASQLQSLTPEQRAQLAKALADAAQHAQDPTMAASLQRASAALSSGDVASAAGALSDVAGQLDSLQDQQSNDQAIAAAINGLEAARQGLAAQSDRDASGTGSSTANAVASSGAAASGNGNGNGTGNGTGAGVGNGSGSGSGSGGSGGTGGVGANGSGTGSGSAAKPVEKLYVPGQPLPGQVVNDPAPLGPGQDVPLTPYTQVVQAYQQAALDATDQSLIPGSERDLVREYFSRLGESAAAP